MITISNYYEIIAGVDLRKLDAELVKAAELVDEVSEKGKDWSLYLDDDVIRRTIDEYFAQLEAVIGVQKKAVTVRRSEPESEITDNYGKKEEPKSKGKTRAGSGRAAQPKRGLQVVKKSAEYVERISEDIRLIDRFASMNGKLKTRNAIRLFIKALHDAINENRIRKSSPYAKELDYIQDSLMKTHAEWTGLQPKHIDIAPARLSRMLEIAGKQEQMLSVKFIKSYISLQGKLITNKQASNLHNRIGKAIDNGSLVETDRYWDEITSIHMNLKSFVKKNKGEGMLVISERELNGLQGISGIGSLAGLNGHNENPRNVRMNSMDFVQLQFEKIGFTGKWLDFFGNPPKGFTALVSAPPKFGKSILCTGWAGYLARNHGTVLYVAKEEGLDDTLKQKLREVAHPNLEVQDYFDNDVWGFDFVFLDSITRLHLTPDDLNTLKANNPGVSFIFISQVTKGGKARGSNEFAHDVDAIIEFPEKGKAVQYGRFNQGGAMRIFTDHQNQ